jgi:L-amino acid N-acyltransferase YncA
MIREATSDDLEQIVAIYNTSIPGRLATADLDLISVDSRRSWLLEHAGSRHPLWVYENEGTVVGWLSLSVFYQRAAWDATAEISVYVNPSHQKQGIAAKLVAEAVSRAPTLGLTSILALIFGHNQPSLNLFRRFGFEDWGQLLQVCELDGIKRDVMILGCHPS